jgi:phosphoglycolate phosphatase-like HAD superfamily hydrolase
MLDLTRIRALCFDVDGTLSDTDDLWVSNLQRQLKKIFPHRDTLRMARWFVMGIESPGNYLYSLLDRIGLDDEVAWFYSKISQINHKDKKPRFWLIPKTRELLHGLHGRYPMAVVSARGQNGTLAFLDQYELRSFFHTIVTAQTCEYTKPFPHPVLRAAQEMGVQPENCVMIGDTTVDIRSGKLAGAQTVGVLCGFGSETELRRAGADLILPTPHDLLQLLVGQASSANVT